ncbi:MAG: hypothetical protein K9G62_03220 [Alphaproteobacteria bacterium]|nr:hypothetical protein [Alphaproteobacteria bacterium]
MPTSYISAAGPASENGEDHAVKMGRFHTSRKYRISPHSDEICEIMEDGNLIGQALGLIVNSPTTRHIIEDVLGDGWTVAIGECGGHDFRLDAGDKTILINNHGLSPGALRRSNYFLNALLVSLIRGLRDAWQEKRHGAFENHHNAQDILMLERLRAADCDVLSLLAAWELRENGFPSVWRHMIGSDIGDVAMAFSTVLERSLSGFPIHTALRAAFAQWHHGAQRVNACDHETLDYLDSLLREDETPGAVHSENLSPLKIESLSCLPDKTAYLQGQGREILLDPLYAGLYDEVNQSHFAQVLHDMDAVYVQGIPFRSAALARMMFPGGETADLDQIHEDVR